MANEASPTLATRNTLSSLFQGLIEAISVLLPSFLCLALIIVNEIVAHNTSWPSMFEWSGLFAIPAYIIFIGSTAAIVVLLLPLTIPLYILVGFVFTALTLPLYYCVIAIDWLFARRPARADKADR